MRIVYTKQALDSLEELKCFLLDSLAFTEQKTHAIITSLLNRVEDLLINPEIGQKEISLEHLNLDHRRLVEGHCKIIYRLSGDSIIITDFFDTRQDPDKMKG